METLKKITDSEITKLIKEWERYINVVAFSIGGQTDFINDLKSVGQMALIEAYKRYNDNKGDERAYFTTCIKYQMMDFMTKYSRIIHLPAAKIKEKEDELQIKHKMFNLSKPINEDGDTIENFLQDENSLDAFENIEENSEITKLKNAIAQLKPKWQYIISESFDLKDNSSPKSLRELGEELGLTKQAIAEQYKNAMKELRKIMGANINNKSRKPRANTKRKIK